MILFSVKIISSLLQIANTITSENLIQPDDLRITHSLATHYDSWKEYNLRHFSLSLVQKCTGAPSENNYTKESSSVYSW